MLHFCRDYIYYSSVEVLEPQSHRFLQALEKAQTVDEVLKAHEHFLDTCLRELLLTERDGLYRHLSKVLSTCANFAQNVHHALHRFEGAKTVDDRAAPAQTKEERLNARKASQTTYLSLVQQTTYAKMISKFKGLFESQLQGFLRQIR